MLKFDLRDFQREAKRMDALASQIPFALARALNDGADVAMRRDLPDVWSHSIEARNANFMRQALSMKDTRATKKMLRVVVYDRFGRANLKLHDVGGRATSRSGKELAIPSSLLAGRRGSKGIPKALRPGNLPDSFVTDGRRPNAHLKQSAVYVRQGAYHKKGSVRSSRGKVRKKAADGRTVQMMYVLKPSNPVRADVPLTQTFNRTMRREVKRAYTIRMRQAMESAHKK